jgi:hypothetical protein
VNAGASEPGTFLKWLITHGIVLTNWEGEALGFCPCEGTVGELLDEYEEAAAEPYDASRDVTLPLSRVIELHVPPPGDGEDARCAERRTCAGLDS